MSGLIGPFHYYLMLDLIGSVIILIIILKLSSSYSSLISLAFVCADLAPENLKSRCLGLGDAIIAEGRKGVINDMGLSWISKRKAAARPVERIQMGMIFF